LSPIPCIAIAPAVNTAFVTIIALFWAPELFLITVPTTPVLIAPVPPMWTVQLLQGLAFGKVKVPVQLIKPPSETTRSLLLAFAEPPSRKVPTPPGDPAAINLDPPPTTTPVLKDGGSTDGNGALRSNYPRC
jgi:hypothetical protein